MSRPGMMTPRHSHHRAAAKTETTENPVDQRIDSPMPMDSGIPRRSPEGIHPTDGNRP
jgi:hypothetical protein